MRYRSRRGRYYASNRSCKHRWGRWWNWVGMALIVIGLPLIPLLIGAPIFFVGLVLALGGLD